MGHAFSPSHCWPCPQKTWTWTNVCGGKDELDLSRTQRNQRAPEVGLPHGRNADGVAEVREVWTQMEEWESGGFSQLQVWIRSGRSLTVVGSGETEFWWGERKTEALHEQLYKRASKQLFYCIVLNVLNFKCLRAVPLPAPTSAMTNTK